MSRCDMKCQCGFLSKLTWGRLSGEIQWSSPQRNSIPPKTLSSEEPPYDITDEIYSSGVQLANKGTFSIASAFFDSSTWSGVAQQTIRNVFLPSGWLTFYSRVNNFDLEVDVKGIFECRDVI